MDDGFSDLYGSGRWVFFINGYLNEALMSDEAEYCANERPDVKGDWREAAAISLVLVVAQVFVAFLTLYDLTRIAAYPVRLLPVQVRRCLFLRHVCGLDWSGEILR
jgi:hypothetical protein